MDRLTSSPRKKATFLSRVFSWVLSRLGADTTILAEARLSRPSVLRIYSSFRLMLPLMLGLRIAGVLETILLRAWSSR